jgi:hypothetical protein
MEISLNLCFLYWWDLLIGGGLVFGVAIGIGLRAELSGI